VFFLSSWVHVSTIPSTLFPLNQSQYLSEQIPPPPSLCPPPKAAGSVQTHQIVWLRQQQECSSLYARLPVVKLFPQHSQPLLRAALNQTLAPAGTGEQLASILWRTRDGRPSVRPQKKKGGGGGSEPDLTRTESNGAEWNATGADRSQKTTSMFN